MRTGKDGGIPVPGILSHSNPSCQDAGSTPGLARLAAAPDGARQGRRLHARVAKQQPQLRNGRTLLAQLVAAGEVNSGLAAYSQNFENLKREGAPVDWVALDPVYGNLNPMGLSAKAT
jgi:hypothetical protein